MVTIQFQNIVLIFVLTRKPVFFFFQPIECGTRPMRLLFMYVFATLGAFVIVYLLFLYYKVANVIVQCFIWPLAEPSL